MRLHPKIEVRESPIEGKGLFAKATFKKGERFNVTEGEHPFVVMTDAEFEAYKQTHDHWDAIALGDGTHKVGTLTREEDPSNYGNHSCDPNIAPDGDASIVLRVIAPGEEITADYAQFSDKDWTMDCNCGATNCTGIVRGKI